LGKTNTKGLYLLHLCAENTNKFWTFLGEIVDHNSND
jgi:hypothetical protein